MLAVPAVGHPPPAAWLPAEKQLVSDLPARGRLFSESWNTAAIKTAFLHCYWADFGPAAWDRVATAVKHAGGVEENGGVGRGAQNPLIRADPSGAFSVCYLVKGKAAADVTRALASSSALMRRYLPLPAFLGVPEEVKLTWEADEVAAHRRRDRLRRLPRGARARRREAVGPRPALSSMG